MIDVINPEGVAVDVKDAVADVACPEFFGRLVQALVQKDLLTADDLRRILPSTYTVRE